MQWNPVYRRGMAIFLISAAMSASLCRAQDSANPVQVGGLFDLIKLREVSRDLELVDFQRVAVKKALAERKAAAQNFSSLSKQASPDERKLLAAQYKEEERKIADTMAQNFLPVQLHRLKQIRMNLIAKNDGAAFGLNDREFQAEMDLTDAQKAEIAAKAAKANKVVEEKIMKLKAEIEKVKSEARNEIIQVLTLQQRQKYSSLVGRPFEGDQPK
jgi:hypothetical protein